MSRERPLLLRVALRTALVGAGALVAFCAVIVHRRAWVVGGVVLPYGLVLPLAATWFGARAAALLDAGRSGAVAFAIGWVVVVVVGLAGRPEGDYVFGADWRGYVMLLGGFGLVALAVAVAVVDRGVGPNRNRLDR